MTMQEQIKINGIIVDITRKTDKEIFGDFYGFPVRLSLARKRLVVRNRLTGKFVSLPAIF